MPDDTLGLLNLAGGHVRLLSHLVDAMRQQGTVGNLLRWQRPESGRGNPVANIFSAFKSKAQQDSDWNEYVPSSSTSSTPSDPKTLKQKLLREAVATAVVGRFVLRTEKVRGTNIEWQKLEQLGLVHFIASGVATLQHDSRSSSSRRGAVPMQPGAAPYVQLRMAPILVAAFAGEIFQCLHSVHVLGGPVSPRALEYQEAALIATRAWLMRDVFQKSRCSIAELVYGTHFSEGLSHLQREVLLPAYAPQVWTETKQYETANFQRHVQKYASDLAGGDKPHYCIVGPGNYAADAWVLLQEAAAPNKPFVLYVSTKQRLHRESVLDHKIQQEADKDRFELEGAEMFNSLYLYITDQYAGDVSGLDPEQVVVVSASQHELYYGVLHGLRNVFS